MIKEYRSIQEVAGPLMVVSGVEGVTYDELGEIELASGEIRKCKVLEENGDTCIQKIAGILDRVQRITGKTGNFLGDDQIKFASLGIVNHSVKVFSFFGGDT